MTAGSDRDGAELGVHVWAPTSVGVLSDTHGSIDPRLCDEFEGVSLIVHAGDVGNGVLEELEEIAPVRAVEGNTDRSSLVPRYLRPVEDFEHHGVRFFVTHDLDPRRGGVPEDVEVVITGHTHVDSVRGEGGRLFVNPGSITHSRRSDGVGTAAIVTLDTAGPSARILYFPEPIHPTR